MDEEQLVNIGFELQTKTMAAVNDLLVALIDAISDVCKGCGNESVLEDYKKHVRRGGELYTCVLDKKRIEEFEKIAQANHFEYLLIGMKDKPETSTIIYKDCDSKIMDLVVTELTKDGIALAESMEISLEDLTNSLDGGLDETTGFKDEMSIKLFRAGADAAKLKYSLVKDEYGAYKVYTATKDFETLTGVPGWLCLQTSHLDEKKVMETEKVRE